MISCLEIFSLTNKNIATSQNFDYLNKTLFTEIIQVRMYVHKIRLQIKYLYKLHTSKSQKLFFK